jgi:hypothetical protein
VHEKRAMACVREKNSSVHERNQWLHVRESCKFRMRKDHGRTAIGPQSDCDFDQA